jgi:hypothetical protein
MGRASDQAAVDGMQHRRVEAGCPLCPLWGIPYDANDPSTHGRQHEHAALLWEAWRGEVRSAREVIRVAAEIGVDGVTEQQVIRHFTRHQVEQPAPLGNLRRQAALPQALALPARQRALIDAVYRGRVLSTLQLSALFYEQPDGSAWKARQRCREDLAALARDHFLYRYYPSAETRSRYRDEAGETLWLLGRSAIPWVERRYDVTLRSDQVTMLARQVRTGKLAHDLTANDLYVELHRACENGATLALATSGIEGQVAVDPRNWFGPGPLGLGYYDQHSYSTQTKYPDGFCAFSITLPRAARRLPELAAPNSAVSDSMLLPLFLEYDRDTRDDGDVAGQLMAYHYLASSPAVGERFPQLSVDGYQIPVLMVFKQASKIAKVRSKFLARAREENTPHRTPILVCSEDDLRAACAEARLDAAIATSIWDAAGERPLPLLPALVRASQRLTQSRRVHARSALRVNLRGARRLPDGAPPAARHELPRHSEV